MKSLYNDHKNIRGAGHFYIELGHPVVLGRTWLNDKGKKGMQLTKWSTPDGIFTEHQKLDLYLDKYKAINMIAIRCDNLTVLDFDNSIETTAFNQFEKMESQIFGNKENSPFYTTCQQYSRSKGVHLFFENDDDLKKVNLRESAGLDVDIQTSKTSLITMHPTVVGKGQYEMVGGGDCEKLPIEIKDFILESMSRLEKKKKYQRKTFDPKEGQIKKEYKDFNQEAYVAKVIELTGELTEGNRNDKLFRSCCNWLTKLSDENCFELLGQINKKCNPPLSDFEVETIFNQARRKVGGK